jgi:ubiquinone/menaquinone biosynthesis C-methylase UbiE
MYQFPRPTSEEMAANYPDEYAVFQAGGDLFSRRGMQRRCEIVLKERLTGHLLDIGCARGEFLRSMRDDYGWKVTGVEISDHAAHEGRLRYHLDIQSGTLADAKFSDNFFDAVTLWDVLEHLTEPAETLTEIRRILKPDGLLVLRLPNAGSWDARLFGKFWAGYDPPRHYYVFDLNTISCLLTQTGFSIQKVNTSIGSYLNFVKSIQFWLTGNSIKEQMRSPLISLFSSLPTRVINSPMTWLKNRNLRGPAMVVSACPINDSSPVAIH